MNYHLRNKKNMVAGNGNFEQIGPSRKKLDTNIFPTVFEYDWLEKIFKKWLKFDVRKVSLLYPLLNKLGSNVNKFIFEWINEETENE